MTSKRTANLVLTSGKIAMYGLADQWQLPGATQHLNLSGRKSRNGTFPFELPYRLINMYSVKGDTAFDPFLGTGTSTFAAMASERNSVGFEESSSLRQSFLSQITTETALALNQHIGQRLKNHVHFVREFEKPMKYSNANHNVEVFTRQETQPQIRFIESIHSSSDDVQIKYTDEEPIIPKVSAE